MKEGGKGVVATAPASALVHGPVGGDAVLEAVELPARISDLHPGLAHVNAQTLAHLVASFQSRKGQLLRELQLASARNCDDGRLHSSPACEDELK